MSRYLHLAHANTHWTAILLHILLIIRKLTYLSLRNLITQHNITKTHEHYCHIIQSLTLTQHQHPPSHPPLILGTSQLYFTLIDTRTTESSFPSLVQAHFFLVSPCYAQHYSLHSLEWTWWGRGDNCITTSIDPHHSIGMEKANTYTVSIHN